MKIKKRSARYYIEKFNLEKHIEGGYFGIVYLSEDKVIPLHPRYINLSQGENKSRKAGSSIYFLLDKNDFSAWHRLKSDEIWHYYDGDSPIDIHIIDDQGKLKTYTLGNPVFVEYASFQVIIKAGNWFAAEVRDKSGFGLLGCTVSPGFEYYDFELAERNHLVSCYKNLEEIINKFTRIN